MSPKQRTRKWFFYALIVLILTICVVFCVEWRYIERLKEIHESEQAPMPRLVDSMRNQRTENRDSLVRVRGAAEETISLCPRLSTDIYKALKKRKQYDLRVEKTIQELWWYIRKRLDNPTQMNVTLNSVRDHYNSLKLRYDRVDDVSPDLEPFQLNWKYWQRNISAELSLVMKKRIEYLQNPSDCNAAKKLVCHVAKSCGFGCQIHHVSFCFILAYATKRTLILDSSNWRYSPRGWDAVFQPISSSCTEIPSGNVSDQCVLKLAMV